MPSRIVSPLPVPLASTATMFTAKFDCANFMKPYAADYITSYMNEHPPAAELSNLDHLPLPLQQNLDKPQKKRVSFADSAGHDLVHVRHMTAGRDTPPDLDPALFSSPYITKERQKAPTLILTFQQPISDYNRFRQSLEQHGVALESISINDNVIIGTIKVKNLGFRKTVFLRMTYDNWVSTENVNAYYVNSGLGTPCSDRASSSVDTFSFTHDIALDRLSGCGIYFAVCFHYEGREFWDNNGNCDYYIKTEDVQRLPATDGHCKKESLPKTFNWTEFAIWRSLESDYTPYW